MTYRRLEPRPEHPTARPSDRLDQQRPPTSDDGSEPTPTVPRYKRGNPDRGRAGRLRARLSERDIAILDSLHSFRLLTGQQLQRLHVTSSNPATAARRTRAVLHRLNHLGAVVRLERRIGGIRSGSEGHVYCLSGSGQAVLARDGLRTGGRTIWQTKPDFQDHLLAIAELYIDLTEWARGGTVELLDFQTEPAAWRWFAGLSGERLPLKPDAFVALGVGNFEQRSFIEIDRGTESLPTVNRKCRRYLEYWRSGQEQHAHGVFPRVWWLVTTPGRLERIRQLVADLARDDQALFAVGLASDGAGCLAAATDGDRP